MTYKHNRQLFVARIVLRLFQFSSPVFVKNPWRKKGIHSFCIINCTTRARTIYIQKWLKLIHASMPHIYTLYRTQSTTWKSMKQQTWAQNNKKKNIRKGNYKEQQKNQLKNHFIIFPFITLENETIKWDYFIRIFTCFVSFYTLCSLIFFCSFFDLFVCLDFHSICLIGSKFYISSLGLAKIVMLAFLSSIYNTKFHFREKMWRIFYLYQLIKRYFGKYFNIVFFKFSATLQISCTFEASTADEFQIISLCIEFKIYRCSIYVLEGWDHFTKWKFNKFQWEHHYFL